MGKVPVNPPIERIQIQLYWKDKGVEGSNGFDTVQQFAQFLKDNPLLAEAVGYVPKKKTR